MNRKEIKEAAKAKIKGNKWNIWWPMLIIGAITFRYYQFYWNDEYYCYISFFYS